MRDFSPKAYRVKALRDCPVPSYLLVCETPDQAAVYWRLHIETHPCFNPECECFVVLFLNTRKRVKGHQLMPIGTMDTLLVHAREDFRTTNIASASGVVLLHNHPGGGSSPSEADIKVPRDFIRAGQILKIEVVDHIVTGRPGFQALRALGYFCL